MTARARGIAAFVALALLTTACTSESEGPSSGVENVTFSMGWLPQGSMSGVLVAIDRGYYRELGLEVSAVRGFGGIRTVNEIDQGMFDFGYADPLAIVLNRENGGDTQLVGAINTRWPAGLCFIRERHAIATPADLVGLKLGGGQSSPMQMLVPAWLELNGVRRDQVELLQLQPSVVVTSLIEGAVDAAECWLGNSMALFQKRAAEAGLTLDWIEYRAFGLDIYGNGIVTSRRMLEEKPDVVRRFLEGTYRGYAFSMKEPEAAAAIVNRMYPVLDPAVTLQQVREIGALLDAPGPLGWIDDAKVAHTIAFLSSAYDIETPIAPEDVFTNAFLPSESAAAER